jgi:hypothetical protein
VRDEKFPLRDEKFPFGKRGFPCRRRSFCCRRRSFPCGSARLSLAGGEVPLGERQALPCGWRSFPGEEKLPFAEERPPSFNVRFRWRRTTFPWGGEASRRKEEFSFGRKKDFRREEKFPLGFGERLPFGREKFPFGRKTFPSGRRLSVQVERFPSGGGVSPQNGEVSLQERVSRRDQEVSLQEEEFPLARR